MANFEFCNARNLGKTLLCASVLVFMLHKLLPMFPKSWNFMVTLIKWRPFIYVIVNFIIISILISSSSFTQKLNNLILKIHKKSSHNISSLISQTSQKLLIPFDDDTWWSRMINNGETENFTPLDESVVQGNKEEKTVSFEQGSAETFQEVTKYEDIFKEITHYDYIESKVEEEEEVDTLDATWKAIMEAKEKGNGPQLKKSGTWTYGDRGVGIEDGPKTGKGRLARYKVELKKWSTYTRDVVTAKKDRGGGGGGVGRGVDEGLTYHDELKNRADAFIAKVTQDMRLQRLESNQRFLNKINHGLK